MPALAIFGEFFLDAVYSGLPAAPRWGREVKARAFTEAPGGGVAITALAASRLGTPTAILTRIGADARRRQAWRELAAAGVTTAGSEIRRDLPTAVAACIAYRGERMIVSHEAVNRDLEALLARPAVRARLRAARHVHLACALRRPRAWLGPLRDLKARGLTLSADIGWNPETLRLRHLAPVLALLDFFFPNFAEARQLTGEADAEKAARALARWVRMPVVKLGARGSLMLVPGPPPRLLRQPALRTRVVDATGAGDAFDGGFLHAYLAGRDWRACLRLGNRCGALACAAAGGAAGLRALGGRA